MSAASRLLPRDVRCVSSDCWWSYSLSSDGRLVEVGGVGVAAAGHRDVEQGAGGVLAEHRVGGVGGDALGAVHGNGVAQNDVLAQVLILEDGAGPVIETFGGDAISGGSMAATRHRLPLRTESR